MAVRTDIVVIGAGFAGLSAAFNLLKHGARVLVIEKESFPGGMASCNEINNFHIEKFYHHFFTHDSDVIALAEELGIADELIWNKSRMGYFSSNRLYSFTTLTDLLRFREVGFIDRLKFGLFSFYARRSNNYESLHGITAKEWVNQIIGSSGYEKIIAPLIKSKFGVHMSDISAAFLKGRIESRAQSRNSFLGKEIFGYCRGGLQNFISVLMEKICKLEGSIRLNTEVTDITARGNSSFVIRTSHKESIECERIIITVPVPVMGKMIFSDIDATAVMNKFDYRSVVCLCLGIKEKLSNYYWINIVSDEIPFGVIVEHTNLVPSSFYNGTQIVYLSGYYDTFSPFLEMDDREIFDLFMKGLKKIFPDFKESKTEWWMVSREPFATPVFKRDFDKLLFELKSRLPRRFHLTGNLLSYPQSRNINTVIKLGKKAAEEIISGYEYK